VPEAVESIEKNDLELGSSLSSSATSAWAAAT